MLAGITEAGDIICVYAHLEKNFQAERAISSGKESSDLEKRLSNTLVALYISVLRFLAKAACHLHHSTARRDLEDALRMNDWAGDLKALREQSRRCDQFDQSLQRRQKGSEKLENIVESLLRKVKLSMEEEEKSLRAEYKKEVAIIKWVSKVHVRTAHWTVRGLMGDFAESSGARVFERVQTWLRSDQPVFWLVGSGELQGRDGIGRLCGRLANLTPG